MNNLSLENYLVTGLDIPLGILGKIPQPTLRDLIENNIDIDTLVRPFLISKDSLGLDKDNPLYDKVTNFDLLFVEDLVIDGLQVFKLLVDSLKFIYSVSENEIQLLGQELHISNKAIINGENFDILAKVIMAMYHKQPSKSKPKPKVKNEAQRKVLEKIQKKREQQAKKNTLALFDYINIVCHIKGFIGYDKVLDLTYYQLLNSYSVLTSIENHREFISYYTSMKFDIKENSKH